MNIIREPSNSIKMVLQEYKNDNIVKNCIKYDNIQSLKILIDNNYHIPSSEIAIAMVHNKICVIKILCDHKTNISYSNIFLAIKHDNIDIIKLLEQYDYKYNAIHMFVAMRNNSHRCMGYFEDLKNNGLLMGSWCICI